jgi:uncharacterized protein (DUF58 family)
MKPQAWLITLISFGLLLTALITRNGDLALMALPFVVLIAAAILKMPTDTAIRLSATRSLDTARSREGTMVEVCVTVRNEGTEMVSLRLADPRQPGMKIKVSDLRQRVVLDRGKEFKFEYAFEAARGDFKWRALRVVTVDPFELFESEQVLPAAAAIQVQPRVDPWRRFPLRPDNTLHAPGSIPAHRGGSGTDFWGVREYRPGDSLRHLDWRLIARHPRQLFTKEFEQEESADIGIILDARQRSDIRVGDESLFDHAVQATASLADLLLAQGHRVSLLVFGDQMRAVFPGYGKAQRYRILRALAGVRPDTETARPSLDFVPLRQFSSRALIVVISPLSPGDESLFPRLRARGNQTCLISPDPIDFVQPSCILDPAGQLALRAARVERHLRLRTICQLHVRVVDWQVHQALSPLLWQAFRPIRGEWR